MNNILLILWIICGLFAVVTMYHITSERDEYNTELSLTFTLKMLGVFILGFMIVIPSIFFLLFGYLIGHRKWL